jgi:pre-rRNA-processing protein RIX1
MAPVTSELATLRALTFRISSTATAQLPQHVPAIAASLANCRTLLSSPQAAATKTSSESSVAVHKYRTLLSTLLQDRTIQGRWSAIVLIKATIEIGGWETLQKSLPWVRGLLGILTKPDAPSMKKLCIITLTRIFILTREYPTLVREITTPSLPAYIQSGLQIANKAPATLLQTILESFNELLPRHPTIFRSYLKQLHPFLARIIAPTPSNKLGPEQVPGPRLEITAGVVQAAQQLYVQTSSCAPKGASSDEWEKSLKTTINSAHQVADRIFRAVFEDWQSSARQATTNGHTLDDDVQDLEDNEMALPPWSGLFAGSERLVQLLRLTQQYLASPTANPVGVNISAVMDVIMRMLSLTIPGSGGKAYQNTVRLNNQISKDERENLWLVLPDVHVATIELLLVVANRFQSSTLPLDALIVDQIMWVFGSEKDSVQIRTACYRSVATLLQRSGVGLSKASVDSLVPLMRVCCDDLLPLESSSTSAKSAPTQTKTNGISSSQTTANADTFLNSSKAATGTASGFRGLHEAAQVLLPVLLSSVRAQYLSDALRSRLDRTATLTQHRDAMVASVLNPPPSKKFGKPAASILPLLARSFAASTDIEGMLRPRMPVIRLGNQDTELDEDGEEEDDEEEEEEVEVEEVEEPEIEVEVEDEPMVTEKDDESFMGNKLDTILESEGRANITSKDSAMPDAPTSDASTHLTSGVGDLLAPSPRELRSSARAQNQSKESVKRVQFDATPSSPSKRLKTGDEEPAAISAGSSIPVVNTTPRQPVVVPQTSDFTVSSTASAVPDLPEPGDAAVDASDSDEDDVVSLVLGQDTDDESE